MFCWWVSYSLILEDSPILHLQYFARFSFHVCVCVCISLMWRIKLISNFSLCYCPCLGLVSRFNLAYRMVWDCFFFFWSVEKLVYACLFLEICLKFETKCVSSLFVWGCVILTIDYISFFKSYWLNFFF